jgi:hypothetical protein
VRSANTGLLGIYGSTEIPVRVMSERGFAAEYATAPLKALPQGTKYYFVIYVPEGQGAKAETYGGDFTTIKQTVVVRFTRMQILNDSDKGSSGDLSFKLQLAPSPNDAPNCQVALDCENRIEGKPWETGSIHPLANTLRMDGVPDLIRVWVTGWDDDTSDDSYRSAPAPEGGRYSGTGGTIRQLDWNTAKGEFNIGAYPDLTRRVFPFSLRSIDGHVLMFAVQGTIEVTRQ